MKMAEETNGKAVKWPYPVNYGKEHRVTTDVLVLGGGVSGAWAAISAAKKGVKVAVVEKGCLVRAGSGGRGVDHWQLACTNPASKVSPEEMTEAMGGEVGGYWAGHARYIQCRESYETLLELEGMGCRIRDIDDEFKGAEFRDEKTKLLFAYEYENRYTIRVWGAGFKPALAAEIKRLGIDAYERTMVTSLLTEGGKPGGRVVGATGLNMRTGEFYVFEAKAVISCMASADRLYFLNTDHKGFASIFHDPNCTGQGLDVAWRAGAEFTDAEAAFCNWHGPISWVPYGTGNPTNTWHGATIVDSNGKEVPWVDRDGRELKTVSERFRPSPGQKFFLSGGGVTPAEGFLGVANPVWYEYRSPSITPKLPEMIRKGEIVPPLYADLTSIPEHERRALFGLMVANEGKTSIPVYRTYTRGGFDPDKDMLQVPNFPNPDAYMAQCYWAGMMNPYIRTIEYGGGLVTDWELRTTLEGLYAAGMQLPGPIEHAGSATTGRYAGRTASEYAKQVGHGKISREQVEAEKARVYAPTKHKFDQGHHSYDWTDINQGLAEIMRSFCPEWKNEPVLKEGLRAIKELRESEAQKTGARNPHELMRVLETYALMTCGEVLMQASLGRKASSMWLDFHRTDYPEVDPPELDKFLTIRFAEDGKIVHGELPKDYWLRGSNAPSYLENYKAHRAK
jgi:succinate dehydrogenase/fumarate reductase flavoprotein subunit